MYRYFISLDVTQSRLVQILGISSRYRLPLRICLFLSLLPGCYWSIQSIHSAYNAHEQRIHSDAYNLVHTSSIHDAYNPHIMYIQRGKYLYAWEAWIASIWFIICAILSYELTGGLLLRWLLKYSPQAALIRLMSLNMMNGCLTGLFGSFSSTAFQQLVFSILMACLLTCVYVVQNYVTSNIALLETTKTTPARQVNLIEITVFAVVPIGITSFITMLFALWALNHSQYQ